MKSRIKIVLPPGRADVSDQNPDGPPTFQRGLGECPCSIRPAATRLCRRRCCHGPRYGRWRSAVACSCIFYRIGSKRTRERRGSTTTIAPASNCVANCRSARSKGDSIADGRTSGARTCTTLRPLACVSASTVPKSSFVREYDMIVVSRPVHDRLIGCTGVTNLRPMICVKTISAQHLNPLRREVHVDHDFHAGASGSSASSRREAAYASASWISPASRYG